MPDGPALGQGVAPVAEELLFVGEGVVGQHLLRHTRGIEPCRAIAGEVELPAVGARAACEEARVARIARACADAAAAKDGEPSPHHVQVIYEVVEPTVDEKLDEVLRLVRSLDEAKAATSHTRTGRAAERVCVESLEPLHRPVPSGWAVKRPAIDARYVDNYLGPLEGWLEDPRRAVLFGNREAAIAAQAALSVESKLPISVVWLVYDEGLGNYREQSQ